MGIYIAYGLLLIAVVVIGLLLNKMEDARLNRISFKETLDLTDLPIATFKQGEKKLNFILDTGANNSVINTSVLDSISYENTDKDSVIYAVDGSEIKTKFVKISIFYRDKFYSELFQVMDVSKCFDNIKKGCGVTIHGIIGNKFLEKHKYILDFNNLVAYSKK